MPRELPDELLSAYLDGEVTAEERATVEAHLAANEADRQLLAELQSLRSDMAALPRASVGPDFADRVVQAAVAKAAASPTALPLKRNRRNWMIAAGAVGAVAACLFIAVVFWRPSPNPLAGVPATPLEKMIAALHNAVPGDGQAVVLRLRLPPGARLEPAISAAGIGLREASATTGASELGAAYRAHLAKVLGSEETIAASQALFVEAPLTYLENLMTALSADPARPCELRTEAQLAFTLPKTTDADPDGVGEARPGVKRSPQPGQPYVQYLPASLFRLQKQTAPRAEEPLRGKAVSDRIVRVLILIEQVEAQ